MQSGWEDVAVAEPHQIRAQLSNGGGRSGDVVQDAGMVVVVSEVGSVSGSGVLFKGPGVEKEVMGVGWATI